MIEKNQGFLFYKYYFVSLLKSVYITSVLRSRPSAGHTTIYLFKSKKH